MNKTRKQKQSGFTLLELLLVVGVGALLLIGGIATYRLVVEGNKVSEATRLLLRIKSEAQNLYANQADYNGLNNALLQNLDVLPPSSDHPFNDAITVQPANGNAQFSVTFANVPETACVKLGRQITDPDDVDSLNVAPAGVDSTTLVADLAQNCNGDTTMVWTFN